KRAERKHPRDKPEAAYRQHQRSESATDRTPNHPLTQSGKHSTIARRSINLAHASELVTLERLLDFGSAVHHERTQLTTKTVVVKHGTDGETVPDPVHCRTVVDAKELFHCLFFGSFSFRIYFHAHSIAPEFHGRKY